MRKSAKEELTSTIKLKATVLSVNKEINSVTVSSFRSIFDEVSTMDVVIEKIMVSA